MRLTRLPPSGSALGPAEYWKIFSRGGGAPSSSQPARRGEARDFDDPHSVLERRLGGRRVSLFGSAREALVALLERVAATSGRGEVVLPAYCCYSVAAAAVATGLSVRLVDVDERGRIVPEHLAKLPLESACAVLVGNLFGLAEPLEPIARLAHAAGCRVIDDAAQSFGAREASGSVAGARGDFGLLSFGRGKPLSALGGGALVWDPDSIEGFDEPPCPAPSPRAGAARALAHAVAMQGLVFRMLSAIPALHIGETPYDPDIRPGPIGAGPLALLAPAIERASAEAVRRSDVALELAAEIAVVGSWKPIVAEPPAIGVYPRLAVLAPEAGQRDTALAALDRIGAGASGLYPMSLDRVPGLAPHLVDGPACAGARDLAARLITLPTHGRLVGTRRVDCLAILAGVS